MTQDRFNRRYFTMRSNVDRIKAWEEAERRKISVFSRLRFFHRPDPDEITCSEFKMYYEPYVIIHASSKSREKTHSDPKEHLNPDMPSNAYNSQDADMVLIIDQTGKKVDDSSPFASLAALSRTFYEEHKGEFLRSDVSVRRAIDTFRELLNTTKWGNSTTIDSLVHHVDIVYVPTFYIEYCWRKTGERKVIKVDGRNCRSEVYAL